VRTPFLSLKRQVGRLLRPPKARPAVPPGVLDCAFACNAYGGYCVPLASRHRPAARAILKGAIWEPHTLELIRANVGTGDVVHAGTYFGDFLPAISQVMAPATTVWAFEPNPDNARCAAATIQISGLRNVVLTPSALGERDGTLRLTTLDDAGRPLGGMSRVEQGDDARQISIEVRALDGLLDASRPVSVIQLDVEGHESQALTGAMSTVRRWKPLLVLETNPAADWIAANLTPLGYQPVGKVHENTIWRARP
jgi:FkbM family methyltransferase